MSNHSDYEFDEPAGDEFDELLAALQYERGAGRPNPEQLKEYAGLHFAREQQRALRVEAAALALHKALQQACDHIRLGTQPDQTEKRRWEEALAGLEGETLLIQHKRAEAVAAAATIVLHELDTDRVQNSTHCLLAATLAAYQAGKQ